MELDKALIKIGWYFSTADGQQVKGFWLYTPEEHPAQFDQSLKIMQSAKKVEPTDLRFS